MAERGQVQGHAAGGWQNKNLGLPKSGSETSTPNCSEQRQESVEIMVFRSQGLRSWAARGLNQGSAA